MSQGWALRVPVVVTNDRDFTLTDWPVTVSLDLGKLLVDGGWTYQAAALEKHVKGFTLDADSVRVVEYQSGFRDFLDPNPIPVPALVYKSLLDKPALGRTFDASTNPLLSVTFLAKGPTAPDAKRFYYVYFQASQYGDVPAPIYHDDATYGKLLAVDGAGAGQVFYGQELGADARANRLVLTGLSDRPTHAAVYILGTGPPQLAPSQDRVPNPMPLNQSEAKYFNVPAGSVFKVVSDRPILLSDHGSVFTPDPSQQNDRATWGAGSFVMPKDGGWSGMQFQFPLYSTALTFYAPLTGSATVNLFPADPIPNGFSTTSFTLGPSNPVQTVTVNPGSGPPALNNYFVTSSAPILVQYGGAHALPSQLPARDGAPWGTDLVGNIPRDTGEALVYADGPANLRMVDPEPRTGQPDGTYPPGPRISTAPDRVAGGLGAIRDLTVNQSFNFPGTPQEILSALESRYPTPGGVAAPLAAIAGPQSTSNTPAPDAGYFTGPGASRILARGPVLVAAHFNETRVAVREILKSGRIVWTNATRNADDLLPLFPQSGSSGLFFLESTKPIAVFSAAQPYFNTKPYARFVPGRLVSPRVSIGALEFRGPLVELSSPDAQGTEVLGTPGPDQPWDFNLAATNKGHWIGGANLADSYTIDCANVPDGWQVFLDGRPGCDPTVETLRLDSGQTKAFKVTVVPKGALPGTIRRIDVTAHSSIAPDVTATLHLKVFVTVTFGVGLWLDVENGLKSTVDPISLDPDEALTPPQKIIIKNLGSVADAFSVKRQTPSEGWDTALVATPGTRTTCSDAGDMCTVPLGPGETQALFLRLKAPPAGGANFNSVEVSARSLQSANAADKVTVVSRIRADIQFELRLAERSKLGSPGKPTDFTLRLLNKGNDIVRVTLTLPPLVTLGWRAALDVTEVNLNPGVPFNATLTVTPAADARAGDQSSLRITGETTTGGLNETPKTDSAVATLVVAQVHDLVAPQAADIVADPGGVFDYSLTLTNHGNGDELVELLRTSVRPSWPVASPGGGQLSLARGDSGTLDLSFSVPNATRARSYELNFSLRLSHESVVNFTLPVAVREVRKVSLDLPSAIRVSPGQEFPVEVGVTNVGNVNATFDLAANAPSGWKFRFDPPSVTLAPAESAKVTAFVNASRTANDGTTAVALKALAEPPLGSTRAPSPAGSASANVSVARPDLFITDVTSTGSTSIGDLLVVTAGVGNRGTIEALDVRVALVVDGTPVDYVTLARVPTGVSKLATLKWTADHRAGTVTVVVNPDSTVVEATPGAKSAGVSFAKPIPLSFDIVGLAIVGAALLARRRRLP